ncbi:hypothetical protein [Amycolatopsis sp. GA6-003]|uniref:hypothetical protein n=1 Tax=Amycolatopsis sp. GA6-003 TaxID=2652444 RepID=UPI0039171D6A
MRRWSPGWCWWASGRPDPRWQHRAEAPGDSAAHDARAVLAGQGVFLLPWLAATNGWLAVLVAVRAFELLRKERR